MNKKVIIGIGALIVLLAAVTMYILLGGRDGKNEGGIVEWFERGRQGEGFASPEDMEKIFAEGMTPEAELKAYTLYARYPHDSRPLSKNMSDLTDPWNIKNVPLPILSGSPINSENAMREFIENLKKEGKTESQIEERIKDLVKSSPVYLFTTNRIIITANEVFTAGLKIERGGEVVSYSVSSAQIIGDPVNGSPGLGSAAFNDVGTEGDSVSGDKISTFSWKSPGADKKYWGSLTLRVKVRPEGSPGEVTVEQQFYSSPSAPARFSGNFQESLVDGSLVIETVVDVSKECRYQIYANLYSVDENEPTHVAHVNRVLSPGRQTVAFTFFGKIFRDGGYEGKFRLQDLRGSCENMPFPPSWIGDPTKIQAIQNAKPLEEPLLLYMPFTNATYVTKEYSSSQFSDREWTSPEKEEKLRMLREAVR